MSYNGIGLKTTKGSSTSGHIQQSLANNNERKNVKNYLSRVGKKNEPNQKHPHRKHDSILRHLSKRQIELRVSEFRDVLEEDESLDDETIDARCSEYRQKLTQQHQYEEKHERLRKAYVPRKARDHDKQDLRADENTKADSSSNQKT